MHAKKYNEWLKKIKDDDIVSELNSFANNLTEIENRFSGNLVFGTAGIRGIMGAGSSYINTFTIAKIAKGVKNYVAKNFTNPSIVIAYDNRKNSREYASLVAGIFASEKVKVYLFDSLTPTPVLSYAVRQLKACLGINITSSHNGKEYNGFKVVNSIGAQIETGEAELIAKEIDKIDLFDFDKTVYQKPSVTKKIVYLDKSIVNEFVNKSLSNLTTPATTDNSFSVVYTPLNGAGMYANSFMFNALKTKLGFDNVFVPESQSFPDPDFTSTPYPNPELESVFEKAVELAKKHNSNIVFATDPDCDRLGVVVRHNKKYIKLSGDDVGVILLSYLIELKREAGQLSENSYFITTVVSSELTTLIAKFYGVQPHVVLTGFKNIGNKMQDLFDSSCKKHEAILKQNNDKPTTLQKQEANRLADNDFVFAYEESIGYLTNTHLRDKDGISPLIYLTNLAATLHNTGLTLVDYLQGIYKTFGYLLNLNYSKEFEGVSGIQKIAEIVNELRKNTPKKIAGYKVVLVVDYLNHKQTKLEKSNFLEFRLENDVKLTIRPSGTEPKLKIYISCLSEKQKVSQKTLVKIKKYLDKKIFS